ncbi:MAG TPA: hypothetical protein VKT80_18260 [Chloroflexota bacterium]|nr:hypothetical protein [Chloroflexota bacterium]
MWPEKKLVAKIIEGLRKRRGHSIEVFKHNDRITRGIPDLSVTAYGRTTWFEVKQFTSEEPRPSEIKKKLEPLQLQRLKRLADCGRAFYICGYVEDGAQRFSVMSPANAHRFGAFRFGKNRTIEQDLDLLTTFL